MKQAPTNALNKKEAKKNDILKISASKELLARSTHLKKKLFEPTEAVQILQRSLKFVRMTGIGLGLDMKYKWKSNRRFVFTKSMAAFIWLLMIYTQSLYIYQHVIVRTAEVFAVYGITVSVALKLHCFETYVKNMTALIKSTLKISQQCTGIHAEKLRKRLQYNFTYYKFLTLLALPGTCMYLYYPVYSYVTKRELVPFVPLEIMFIDQSTMSGYCIASSLMVSVGILAVLGTLYMVLTFVIIILNYGPRVDIFEANFKELDELWSGVSSSSIEYRHMFLRNICLKVVDMMQIIGYQAMDYFLEMIFYCIMGTKLTVENDRLCYIISQSNWYTYDMRSQKIIAVLLNMSLNFDELWIGPLKPLSVLSATEIVKSIYTYYTVMVEVM